MKFALDDDEKRFLDYLQHVSYDKTDVLWVLDVGAAKGNYSQYMWNFFWRNELRFSLFEPTYQFEKLSNTLKQHPWFYVHNWAVGDEDKSLSMAVKENPEHSSIFSAESAEYVTVKMITLNDYIDHINRVADRVFLLKIDVEGAEFKVIDGLGESIDLVDNIQLEYGGQWVHEDRSINECIAYLESKGFMCLEYSLVNRTLNIVSSIVDDMIMRNLLFVRDFDELA